MADTLTPCQRSERMSRVRGKDTKLEFVVRRAVHGMGFRYRLHDVALPGTPDLVFPSRKKVILVHGCFWHRHRDQNCTLARLPKSRLEFWHSKLEANRRRDSRNEAALTRLGWKFLVVWECEIRNMKELKENILEFLGERACAQ